MNTNQVIDKIQQEIGYAHSLFERWGDEKEYEDIADYGKAFSKKIGMTAKAKSRPFSFTVKHQGDTITLKAKLTKTAVSWELSST